MPPCDIDFGRSFVYFRSTRINHTPRLLCDAACSFISPDGGRRDYYLSCPCIGEAMYVRTGLIHEPVMEFNIIASPTREFMIIKRYADTRQNVRSAHRFGEVMPTQDGQGARVVRLDVHLARQREAEPVTTYEQFEQSLLNHRVMNGRTTWTDGDGRTQVVLEYPLRTVNVRHDGRDWQVDAGPILAPVPGAVSGLEVSRLDIAYLVYNRFDYGEITLRRHVASPGEASHFQPPRGLECRHEMWVMGDA